MTGLSACNFALAGRGALAAGNYADITINLTGARLARWQLTFTGPDRSKSGPIAQEGVSAAGGRQGYSGGVWVVQFGSPCKVRSKLDQHALHAILSRGSSLL